MDKSELKAQGGLSNIKRSECPHTFVGFESFEALYKSKTWAGSVAQW